MLDTRGEPVRLLLEGADDDLFLARNALGHGRTRTPMDTGEASTLGGNRIRLEGAPVDWFLFTKMDLHRLGFWSLRLPKDLSHVTHFETRMRMVAGFQEVVDGDYYRWGFNAVRLGKRLVCAAQRTNTGLLWIWRSADDWREQRPSALGPIPGGVQQFFFADRFYLVDDVGSGDDIRLPLTGYDYRGAQVSTGMISAQRTPGLDLRELILAQGHDGHFFILIEETSGDGLTWTLRILKRHVDAPDTDVRVFDPITLTHGSVEDMLFPLSEYGKWLFVPWGKHTSINETSPHDGAWAYDLWCFNQNTGQAALCYEDSAVTELTVRRNGQAFARRFSKVTFTMTGSARTAAKVYVGVDQYHFGDATGTPNLTDRQMLTDPALAIEIANTVPGGSLPINTVDRQTGFVFT